MIAENKKELIYQAAVKVISEKGINNFSIKNVCEEANISKGGLFYQFSSKEVLLKSLHEYIINYTKHFIDEERKKRDTFTESYMQACLLVSKSDEAKVYISLLNYDVNHEIKSLWETFYEYISKELSKELSDDLVTLVLITTNGIFTKGNFYSEGELKSALNLLISLSKPR